MSDNDKNEMDTKGIKKNRGKRERSLRRKKFEKMARLAAEQLEKDAQSSKKSSEEPSGVPLEDLDYDGVVGMENGASDAVDEPVNSEVLKIFPKESEINPDDGLKSIEMETTGLNNDPTNSEIVKNSDPDQTEDHTNQNQGGELESESVQEVTVNGEASKSSENFAKVADETSNPKDIRFFFEDKDMVFGKRRQQDLRKEYRNEKTSNCLVIYNPEFKNGECDDGILADLENVYGLFQNLNFKMYRCSNQTAEGIRQKIKKFAELSNHGDAALLIVLTHGDSKGVMGVDKQYFDPMSIFDLLGPEKAPALAGKPKIVLYEHCRGSSEDRGFAIVNDDDDEVHRANDTVMVDGKSQSWIPKNADFLINFSTSAGQSSFANKVYGSKHMQIMCQVFAQRAHCDCLEEMLREIRNRMADLEIVRRRGTIFKQMPETHSTLRKSFFFKVRKLE
ncbi:hypothetical protein B9Z55_012065 [Caenorhabditis nigoni]|nr:hypothetical protein B9Z55_012065 [Caenorhabditis nigoni]